MLKSSNLVIGGLVIWTSHGGLRRHIHGFFGKDATSNDLKDRVGHMGDLLYYYAIIATFLAILITFLKGLQTKLPKIENYTPTMASLKELLLDETQYLVIFTGIYVYLIYNDSSISFIIIVGLKNKQIVLFPYWFLLTIALEVIGRALTKLSGDRIIFTRAAFYLYSSMIIMMLSQIMGYQPFKLI